MSRYNKRCATRGCQRVVRRGRTASGYVKPCCKKCMDTFVYSDSYKIGESQGVDVTLEREAWSDAWHLYWGKISYQVGYFDPTKRPPLRVVFKELISFQHYLNED